MVVQLLVAILVFLQEKMSIYLSTPPFLVTKDELFTQYFFYSSSQSSKKSFFLLALLSKALN